MAAQTQEEEVKEEEAKSKGKLPHLYTNITREPQLHSKDHLWLETDEC